MSIFRAPDDFASVAAIAASLVLLAPAGQAVAQGTMGTLPDPISTRELDAYAKRLGLSQPQRQAIELFHDQYREAFARLRDTDIQKFLSTSRAMQGGMGALTIDRAQAEQGLRDLEAVLGKVRSLDNALLDQVQTVLSDEQSPMLPRVRQARERVRYRSGLGRMTVMLSPAAHVDLSELLDDMTLDPQELEASDALIAQYETALTSAMRKMHESSAKVTLDMLDRLQQLGFNEQTMRDPERRGEMFQMVRTIWQDMNRQVQEKAADVTDLNRRTVKSLSATLGEQHAQALRQGFYQRAYPEVSAESDTTARAFREAAKFSELTDEQRQAVLQMSSDYLRSADRIVDQMVDRIEENRRARGMFDFDPETREKFQQQLQELRDRRSALRESSRESLRAALGPELSERLDQRVAEAAASDDAVEAQTVVRAAGPGFGGVSVTRRFTGAGGPGGAVSSAELAGASLPGPISRRDLDMYAARLKLSDDARTIAASLHSDYREKFQAIEDNQIKTAREAERNLWSMGDSGSEIRPPTAEMIDRLAELRRAAMQEVMKVDDQFFSDLETVLSGPSSAAEVQRVRDVRRRDIYARAAAGGAGAAFFPAFGRRGGGPGGGGGSSRAMFGMSQSNEHGVDLAAIVDDLNLPQDDREKIDNSLAEYEKAVTASFEKLYETSTRMQTAMDKLTAQMTGGPGGQGGDRQGRQVVAGGFSQVWENEGRAAREARVALAELNRSTLKALAVQLPSGPAQDLRTAFNRKAFPQVYSDASSAEPTLTAALSLADLTGQQRAQVQELAAEFHGGYDALCEKLVELHAAAPELNLGGGPPANFNWQGFQDQMRAVEKTEFERDELSARIVARLRATLSPDQAARVPGLAKPAE